MAALNHPPPPPHYLHLMIPNFPSPASSSSSCWSWRTNKLINNNGFHHRNRRISSLFLGFNTNTTATAAFPTLCVSVTSNRSALNASDTRIPTSSIEIPVTCYQIIGLGDKAEKDEIVKSVMQLKGAEVEDGFTMDAVISRQNLLMDVRDKLLFEPEFAGNVRDKIPPKSSLRIPWAWLPGALCLLQEVGEEKLVLEIGRAALQHPDAKPYTHDLLLAMALAECAIAKFGFEANKVSYGFEALARAQCLLRSKISLANMSLLSQIEESLEELAPACTLELLGMSHSPENTERRQGAIAALRELLRQGLDVETACRVDDWPCFTSQALNRLLATEIVDLLPWNDIALVRKNKKSIESQNQRVVIDFNCFHVVLMAHIALGFVSKQIELIRKAKSICECLMASEGIDLKFEEAFLMFLLGQGNDAQAVEKLHQLALNSNPAPQNLIPVKEIKDVSGVTPSLETWLKDCVLALFSDTRDFSPSLVDFFGAEKRTTSKKSKLAVQSNSKVAQRPVSDITLKRIDCGESLPYTNSSQHMGSAVKQLAPTELQSSLILGRNNSESNVNEPSVQLKRDLGATKSRPWESWFANGDVIFRMTFVSVLGCIVFITFNLSFMNFRKLRLASKLEPHKKNIDLSSLSWKRDSSLDDSVGTPQHWGNIAGRMRKLLAMVKMEFKNKSDPKKLKSKGLPASISSSMVTLSGKQMPVEEAEMLVKQWQMIKAQALGSSHQVDNLSGILDESMLAQWEALADNAKARSCYWRFVLLQLSVLQADIWSDRFGVEMAEIEALIEEAAELVDESQHKKPNYYSTYKVRYVLKRKSDGTWRFCEGDIETPS